MRSDSRESGFALVEVLVAMVVLSIGLLGLNALAISAANSTARSERMSRATMAASEVIEVALFQLRSSTPPLPVQQVCRNPNFEDGDRVSLDVNASDPRRVQLRAVITAKPRTQGAPAIADTIITYGYRDTDNAVVVTGSACP
jgi:prepilin-type N-terminal cleavage/methylation domain-containing protein